MIYEKIQRKAFQEHHFLHDKRCNSINCYIPYHALNYKLQNHGSYYGVVMIAQALLNRIEHYSTACRAFLVERRSHMDRYRFFLTGVCTGIAIVTMAMKLMRVLDIELWILMLPVITPAACTALICLKKDGKT